jgi:chromosome segregation ATPase
MSEETTKNFDGEESFAARVLSELARLNSQMTAGFASVENRLDTVERRLTTLEGRVAVLDGRITALEEKVDARLHDTRPIWEAVISRLKVIDKKLDLFAKDMMELRAEMELLKDRLPSAA